MTGHWRCVSVLMGCAAAGIFTPFLPAQELHLKARAAGGVPRPVFRSLAVPALLIHQIVQFDHPPSTDDLHGLMAAGALILAVVPDNAVMVFGPRGLGLAPGAVRWIGELDANDKISPALGTDKVLRVIVEFHSNVTIKEQDAAAAKEGIVLVRPSALMAQHAITSAGLPQLQKLAGHDEVAYIFPADPALLTGHGIMACAGMLTVSGPVAQYTNLVHGWSLESDRAVHLRYLFGAMTARVPDATAQSQILHALDAWSAQTNVTFQQGSSGSDSRTIVVKFASGSHGDAYPFAPGQAILAHTFYPVPVNAEPVAGDMHLNADENWNVGGDIDIYSVALHEAGHALGLAHTDNPGDVMYPYYRRGMQLSVNDIGAVQALYGLRSAVSAPPAAISSKQPPAPVAAAPVPLALIFDPLPLSGPAAQVSVSGMVSGGVPPVSLQWQTSQGYSGHVSPAVSGVWTISGITLLNGANTLTFTAFDGAHKTITQTVQLTRTQTAPVSSTGPVSISITSPASAMMSTSAATLSLSGKAAGGTGITRVFWQTSGGVSGTATGVGPWLASNIPLMTGTNTIIVRAADANGTSAWATVVAVRR